MSTKVRQWLRGLGAAFIGGGAGAITSGVVSMGIAPDKFNFADTKGALHLLSMMAINFGVSGLLNAMFYLKQSPLPPESTGNTEQFVKPADQ